jgi:hypothetical protein
MQKSSWGINMLASAFPSPFISQIPIVRILLIYLFWLRNFISLHCRHPSGPRCGAQSNFNKRQKKFSKMVHNGGPFAPAMKVTCSYFSRQKTALEMENFKSPKRLCWHEKCHARNPQRRHPWYRILGRLYETLALNDFAIFLCSF